VTYLWGADWDLPTLLKNCEDSGCHAVELRTSHAHGVEPALNATQRDSVRKLFADSPVECLGPGSDERFDSPDPDELNKAIAATKAFIHLSHDVGGSGVKVKPNSFHADVPREKTLEQVGKALKELAEFGDGFGQEIRLEVHGQMAELPYIQAIMEVADHPAARVCWNSNKQDLEGEGLIANFDRVKEYFGRTAHVRELDVGDYPYAQLFEQFVKLDYAGWILLEARTKPEDRVAAIKRQRALFYTLIAQAQKKL
jgi:sugar phosphate isomerase/epimerase